MLNILLGPFDIRYIGEISPIKIDFSIHGCKTKKQTYSLNNSSTFNCSSCTLTLLDICSCYCYLLAKLKVISSLELGNSTRSPCSSCTIALCLNAFVTNIWMCLRSSSQKLAYKTWSLCCTLRFFGLQST